MFCDLADSTTLTGRLDPEDYREVVRAYQMSSAEVIQRFEGYIAQYLGDGLLVYFGYPQAHEDDAQRAVRAGLGILEAMEQLNTRLEQGQGVRLGMRLGIHTGPVVVGEIGGGGRHEQLALGETPNLAARLQGLAAPNTVVISAATQRLVQGYFACQALGQHALKGIAAPVQVYRVLSASGAQSRLEAAGSRGLTPFVGREQEVTLLLERWQQAREGRGQVVVLSGEAGIGKSRLVQVIRERTGSEAALCLEFRCLPYHTNSAWYPVIEHLARLLQFHRDDVPEKRVARLERVLEAYRLPLQDVVPLLTALLSLPVPTHYPPLNLSPQRQKQQTQQALVAWLVAEAERQPVLAVWEDLHWADPSTLELLSLVLDQTPTAPLLTLLTCRPDFCPPWGTRSHLSQLTLPRFTRPQVEEMIARVTGGKALPAEVVEQIVTKTDGVPLFVEELTKTVLESGLLQEEAHAYVLTGPLPALAIPATLQDSLMARLDRLVTAKGVAQLGAVIGRRFSFELLQAIAPLDAETLQRELTTLVEAELLYQHSLPPQATYIFKHALIQEAAYQSLLKRTQQQYHQRIAQVLEAQFPEIIEAQPELLAHHYTEAGLTTQAISYWQRAGQRAVEHSANLEALGHLGKALEMLETLPHTPERTPQELAVQITLGPALMATRGYAAPEVEKAYTWARELCQQLGETPQLFTVLRGLWGWYIGRAELHAAHELGEQCLALAQRAQNSAFFLWVHYALGMTLFHLGEFAAARAHFAQGLALYDPRSAAPRVLCRTLGWPTCRIWLMPCGSWVTQTRLYRRARRPSPWPTPWLTPLASPMP
jgi:class 3 adenylate cyclase/tetratricopeptide (TPR) repeat protein